MGSSLHFFFPVALILLGFFGLVLTNLPKRQVLAWALFQMGWLIALFQLEPRSEAMTLSIAGVLGLVSLGVFLVLWALGRQVPSSTQHDPKSPSRKGPK